MDKIYGVNTYECVCVWILKPATYPHSELTSLYIYFTMMQNIQVGSPFLI